LHKGRLLVVSGPSGVGKTTLIKMLLDKYKNDITFSVSHTSRGPRKGEMNGKDYIFVTKNEFKDGIKKDIFLEYAKVYENFYGTSKEQVEKVINSGKDCLLDIDVQGGISLMEKNIKAVYIFIAPPSLDVLKERLFKRSTDSVEVINKRLSVAEREIKQKDRYDYVIINENLDKAFTDLEKIYLYN